MGSRALYLGLAAATLFLTACRQEQVSAYRVPKEADPVLPAAAAAPEAGTAPLPSAAPGGSMANTAVPTAGGPSLVWAAPAEWKPKPASAMRKGSYAIGGPGGADADLSITAFPGDVGGELANVNRWRGQLQLAPLAPADLDRSVERFQAHGLAFTVVDMASAGPANPQRILGAIIPVDGSTWFFKVMGPDSVVTAARPAFQEFLKTVKAP